MLLRHFCRYTGGCFLLLLLLVACGGQSSSVDTSAVYLTATENQMGVITWQKSGDELQGEWITRKMPDPGHFFESKPSKSPWVGKVQDGTSITLTTFGALLVGHLEGQQLTITGTGVAGYSQKSTWYKITREQADQYQAAFDATASARKAFDDMKLTVEHPPSDSSEYWYAALVRSAESYVSGLASKRDGLNKLGEICYTSELGLFRIEYPPPSWQFVLSPYEKKSNTAEQNAALVTRQTKLWEDSQAYEQAWSRAVGKSVPKMEGVDLSWQKAMEESIKQRAKNMLTKLEGVLRVDYATMEQLSGQATQIGEAVERRANAEGCPRR